MLPEPQVRDEGEYVMVVGLSAADTAHAIELFKDEQTRRTESTSQLKARLSKAPSVEACVPPSAQAQATRAAALRAHLLRLGFYDNETLAGMRDTSKVSTVRTWVTRKRQEHTLVTVEYGGKAVVPAVLVDAHGRLREEIAALTKPLVDASLNGWAVWAWLCTPTDFLSGDIPSEVATKNPDRARVAAERYAAQVRGRE